MKAMLLAVLLLAGCATCDWALELEDEGIQVTYTCPF